MATNPDLSTSDAPQPATLSAPAALLARLRGLRANGGGLRVELIIGLGLKILGATASFGLTWLLARLYGATTVGSFQVALATVTLISVLAGLALDNVLVRSLSRALREQAFAVARASYDKALVSSVLTTAVAAVVLFVAARPFARYVLDSAGVAPFLRFFAISVVVNAVLRIVAALLRSTGRIVAAQSIDGVSYTTLSVIGLGLSWLIGLRQPTAVPAIYVGAQLLVAVTGLIVCRRIVRRWPRGGIAAISITSGGFMAASYAVAFLVDLNSMVLITRHFAVAQAGVFRVAGQIAMLFMIVNTAFATISGPWLARAAAADDRAAMWRVIRTSSATGLALCVPIYVVVMIWPHVLLGLFGPEFVAGSTALRLLTTAQLINVGLGPIGAAVMMSHRERRFLASTLTASGTAILVAYWTIPLYGVVGAAAVSFIAVILSNLLLLLSLEMPLRRSPASPPAEGAR